jgi:hypothetical protein
MDWGLDIRGKPFSEFLQTISGCENTRGDSQVLIVVSGGSKNGSYFIVPCFDRTSNSFCLDLQKLSENLMEWESVSVFHSGQIDVESPERIGEIVCLVSDWLFKVGQDLGIASQGVPKLDGTDVTRGIRLAKKTRRKSPAGQCSLE